MTKLTLTLASAACTLLVSACQDATQPEAVDPGTILSATGAVIPISTSARITKPSFSSSSSGDTPCVGSLPPGTYDNIVVPPNGFCVVNNSIVQGNIKALENSFLLVNGGTTVHGSIQGNKINVLEVTSNLGNVNIVHGNIEIKEGNNAAACGAVLTDGKIQIEKMRVVILVGGLRCAAGFGGGNTLEKGDTKVEDNVILPGLGLQIGQNLVRLGNLQVFKNRGAGVKTVQGNTVGQNLQCFENDPPFIGGPNTAGKAEGQCF